MELVFFFFNDTATTEIYTLSLHDALPISNAVMQYALPELEQQSFDVARLERRRDLMVDALTEMGYLVDRKSTRLNSSHANISYAVFCLKKKKKPIMCVYQKANICYSHTTL